MGSGTPAIYQVKLTISYHLGLTSFSALRRRDDLSLELMTDTLPVGFAELEADAKTDGHGHLTRLAAEFAQSPAIFHAIFACHVDGRLAGIGAITDEPGLTSQPTWRMRRLYVHRKFRRRKVARAIANALLQEAAANVSIVTVHAGNEGAARFWEAVGFRPVAGCAWSHGTTTSSATLLV
jgi:GNAT superfamily N-acetyltransferase